MGNAVSWKETDEDRIQHGWKSLTNDGDVASDKPKPRAEHASNLRKFLAFLSEHGFENDVKFDQSDVIDIRHTGHPGTYELSLNELVRRAREVTSGVHDFSISTFNTEQHGPDVSIQVTIGNSPDDNDFRLRSSEMSEREKLKKSVYLNGVAGVFSESAIKWFDEKKSQRFVLPDTARDVDLCSSEEQSSDNPPKKKRKINHDERSNRLAPIELTYGQLRTLIEFAAMFPDPIGCPSSAHARVRIDDGCVELHNPCGIITQAAIMRFMKIWDGEVVFTWVNNDPSEEQHGRFPTCIKFTPNRSPVKVATPQKSKARPKKQQGSDTGLDSNGKGLDTGDSEETTVVVSSTTTTRKRKRDEISKDEDEEEEKKSDPHPGKPLYPIHPHNIFAQWWKHKPQSLDTFLLKVTSNHIAMYPRISEIIIHYLNRNPSYRVTQHLESLGFRKR